MIRKATLLLLAFLCLAAPASAGPLEPSVLDSDDVAWFYNRPGGTLEEIATAQNECRGFGAQMMGTNSPAYGEGYGLAGQFIGAIAAAGPIVANTDDCMMSRGYRRFDVAGTRLRDFQTRFAALPGEQQALYAGAETPPEGVLGRQWVNTYWLLAPGDAPAAAHAITPRATDVPTFNRWGQPRQLRAVAAGAPITLGAGEAVVFVTARAPSGSGAHVMFDRREANGDAAFTTVGGGRRWPGFEVRAQDDSVEAARLAFIVPEGVYALSNVRTGRYDFTTMCLGTVAFQIGACEAVDLGDFTMEPSQQIVDPRAPAPKVRLRVDQPEANAARAAAFGADAFAQSLRRATYFNGFPRACQLFSRIYGFDIPGAATWGAASGETPP
jgi:hypothetical protein